MAVFEVVSGGDRRSLIKRFERKSKHDAVSELVDIHLAHCTRIEKLEAEAQALREQNTKFQHMLADVVAKHFTENIKRSAAQKSMDVYLSEGIRLLEEELEALRARVVVPDGYVLVPVEPTRDMFIAVNKEDDKAYAGGCDHGAQFDWLWDAALEAAPRLNGKAVSEGLLQKSLRALELSMCKSCSDSTCCMPEAREARNGLRALLGDGKELGDVLVRE